MKIDRAKARYAIRTSAAGNLKPDPTWTAKVERLSQLCEGDSASKTHVAMLGTAILAKVVEPDTDLCAFKPKHAKTNPRAYSARSLCESVLVPLSAELGFSLGVTGSAPLNNQPYFRKVRLDDDIPVREGGKPGFDYMLSLVRELQSGTSAQAQKALGAFIAVRRQYVTRYADLSGGYIVTPQGLEKAISSLVGANSEGGKRAQAVVAGLLDVVTGPDRVESGRVNDPSRHYPGDVAVRDANDHAKWEKAIEVRDKPVNVPRLSGCYPLTLSLVITPFLSATRTRVGFMTTPGTSNSSRTKGPNENSVEP